MGHNFPRQPVRLPHHPHSKDFFPSIQPKLSGFEFEPILSIHTGEDINVSSLYFPRKIQENYNIDAYQDHLILSILLLPN